MNQTLWMKWMFDSSRGWADVDSMIDETGIDIVDHDHKTIAEFIVSLNLLASRLSQEITIDAINEQKAILEKFLRFIKFHIAREEKMIEIFNKDALNEHKERHLAIYMKIEKDVQYYLSGEYTCTFDTARLIFEPLFNHMNIDDKNVFHKSSLDAYISGVSSWNQLYDLIRSMGMDSMDLEHRQICIKLLALLDTIGKDYKKFRVYLEEFYRIFWNHCTNEESVMEKYSMDTIETHKEAHKVLLSQIQDGILYYRTTDPEKAEKSIIHSFFTSFVTHINTVDYESFRKGRWRTLAMEKMQDEEIIFLLRKTGIAPIDNQHQEYIRKVMQLFQKMNSGETADEISRLFMEIIDFAGYHFSEEEKIFPAAVENFSPRHYDEHRILLENLHAFLQRFLSSSVYSRTVIRETILKWWLTHTNFTDIDTFGSWCFKREAEDE